MRRADRIRVACACLMLWLAGGALAQSAGEGARSIASLTPEQREALQRRAEAWDALPAPLRLERREAWAAWRALPNAERARMHAAREAYRALPVAEQQALRARFDALDAGIRRGWLLGPELGADWPQLHALFAQVTPGERDGLVEALRALPEQARADLGVLGQRTPPHDRAQLRAELMAQPPAQRAAWLRRRVEP
jgi:hypothetical protein